MNPHKMTTPEEKPHQNNLFKHLVMQTATATRSITSFTSITSISSKLASQADLTELASQHYSVQGACDADQATSRCSRR